MPELPHRQLVFGTLSLSPQSSRFRGSPWDLLCCPSSLSPPHPSPPHMQVWCRCITTIFNYFVVTNFFWMFVEGCYLHTAIVMTYSTEHLRKWLFLFIGWCEDPWLGGPPGRGALLIKYTLPPPFILRPRTEPSLPGHSLTIPAAAPMQS